MTIPKQAFFFWNKETPFTYLRYLTLQTFRYHHPNWQMSLYLSNSNIDQRWGGAEKQDFMTENKTDYLSQCSKLNVEVKDFNFAQNIAPNFISDFFRWEILKQGGWYFDVDQIILKSFDDLQQDFIFGATSLFYVGVVGVNKDNILVDYISKNIHKQYNPENYCCIGPWMLGNLFKRDPDFIQLTQQCQVFQTPDIYFYPVLESHQTDKVYNGDFLIPAQAYALHWYGGHPFSQEFNSKYSPEYAKTSKDSISRYIRDIGLID